jgi:hypothetical protein
LVGNANKPTQKSYHLRTALRGPNGHILILTWTLPTKPPANEFFSQKFCEMNTINRTLLSSFYCRSLLVAFPWILTLAIMATALFPTSWQQWLASWDDFEQLASQLLEWNTRTFINKQLRPTMAIVLFTLTQTGTAIQKRKSQFPSHVFAGMWRVTKSCCSQLLEQITRAFGFTTKRLPTTVCTLHFTLRISFRILAITLRALVFTLYTLAQHITKPKNQTITITQNLPWDSPMEREHFDTLFSALHTIPEIGQLESEAFGGRDFKVLSLTLPVCSLMDAAPSLARRSTSRKDSHQSRAS